MPKGIGYGGKSKTKKARGNSKASHQGPVTGPNSPSGSGSKMGGSGNREQTLATVQSESYVSAKGD